MSELIAEARVLVVPDTTTFRALLTAELKAITKAVPPVPVQVVPTTTGRIDTTGIVSDSDKIANSIRGSDDAMKKFDNSAKNAGKTLAQAGRGAGAASLSFLGLRGATLAAGGGFLSGAAAIAVFAKSVGSFASFETELNTFRVTADATGAEMAQISDTAKQLGADLTLPGVTAQDAAEGLAQLSRAGLDVQDSVDGIRGVLQLATAAAIDNETAVLLVAGALNAFKLAGTDAERVADLLAASSKESQGSIEDMGLALQQAAAASAQAGISVEDTIAILTQLGRAGLRGSDAGTSLRTAILRIINPSKQAKEALEGLGVQLRDLDGNIRPEAFGEIASQAAKLGPALRDQTIALIGGQDAFRAISILGREGADGLNEMRDATQEAGVAAELAAARTQGLAGSTENLKNQFQTLGLSIGEASAGPLKTFVNSLAQSVSGINSVIGFLGNLGAQTPRAEQSISELADEFARLNEEAGGSGSHDEAVRRIEELGKAASIAVLEYADLTKEAGEANAAVARGTEKGFVSKAAMNEMERLNDELREAQSEGVAATDVIEGFKSSMDAAGGAAEGLRRRLDESFDRLAPSLQQPTAPTAQRRRVGTLQGQVDLAQSRGDIAEVERVQEQILANAIKAERNGIRKSVEARQKLFNERVAAEASLNATRRQLSDQQASDAREAATAADRAVLDRAQGIRTTQENALARAEQTKGLADDIRETKSLRALLLQQIGNIRAQVADVGARRAAVQALISARIALAGDLTRLRAAQKAEREANEQAAREERTENLALRTQIAEARGNDSAVIQRVNAQIADAKKAVTRAKAGTQEWLKATLAYEELRKKRRELLKQVEGEGGGTTAFDLLTEAAQRFTGGNLIGAAQPFAGPTEFTADISQFLRRNATTTTTGGLPSKVQQNFQGFEGGIDRLVTALEANTAALTGGELGPPVRKGKRPPVSGAIDRNDRRWRDSAQARETIEGAG